MAAVEPRETQGEPKRVVQVVPLLKLQRLGDRSFDYLVPPALADQIRIGSVVVAPFGRRTVRAVVVGEELPGEDSPAELKALEGVSDDHVAEALLGLARELSEIYLSSYESCLRLVAPPSSTRPGGVQPRARSNWVVRVAEAPGLTGAEARSAVRLTDEAVVRCSSPCLRRVWTWASSVRGPARESEW